MTRRMVEIMRCGECPMYHDSRRCRALEELPDVNPIEEPPCFCPLPIAKMVLIKGSEMEIIEDE